MHLHRNLNQKQHLFAFQIAPVTVVKLLDSITSSRIRKGQFLNAKAGSILDANQQAGVLLLPGTFYGEDFNSFRVGFGRKNLPESLKRFEEYIRVTS